MKTTRSPTSRAKRISWVTTAKSCPSGQILHYIENLADHFGVQSTRGFVKEHYIGLHTQGADYSDPLL